MYRTLKYIWNHPLTSTDRFGALRRYFSWQIGSRLLRRPVIMPFVEDSVLVAERGINGATGNIYCGLHEFADMAFLLHLLRETDLFLDVGANIGSYTLLASAVVGASSICVEPIPSTYQMLSRNILANSIDNKVDATQSACGKECGTLTMTAELDCMNRVVTNGYQGRTVEVPVTTIDDLLNGRTATCWKIDIEGHELDALNGAVSSIASSSLQAVIMEGDDVQIRERMIEAGFQLMAYDPWNRTLRAGPSTQAITNNLWVRDPDVVQARCTAAPKFSVLAQLV